VLVTPFFERLLWMPVAAVLLGARAEAAQNIRKSARA
jgi:hypothetical protein